MICPYEKELLLAALSTFRDQLISDTNREIHWSETCIVESEAIAHKRNADALIEKTKEVIALSHKITDLFIQPL